MRKPLVKTAALLAISVPLLVASARGRAAAAVDEPSDSRWDGWWISPGAVVGATIFADDPPQTSHLTTGVELSAVRFHTQSFSDAAFQDRQVLLSPYFGGYVDMVHTADDRGTRLSAGPVVGIGFGVVDGEVVWEPRASRVGLAGRVAATSGPLSLYVRTGVFPGKSTSWAEMGVLIKFPLHLGSGNHAFWRVLE